MPQNNKSSTYIYGVHYFLTHLFVCCTKCVSWWRHNGFCSWHFCHGHIIRRRLVMWDGLPLGHMQKGLVLNMTMNSDDVPIQGAMGKLEATDSSELHQEAHCLGAVRVICFLCSNCIHCECVWWSLGHHQLLWSTMLIMYSSPHDVMGGGNTIQFSRLTVKDILESCWYLQNCVTKQTPCSDSDRGASSLFPGHCLEGLVDIQFCRQQTDSLN